MFSQIVWQHNLNMLFAMDCLEGSHHAPIGTKILSFHFSKMANFTRVLGVHIMGYRTQAT